MGSLLGHWLWPVPLLTLAIYLASALPVQQMASLAFVSNRDGNQEIYLLDSTHNLFYNLTKNPAQDDYPVWSPDGTRLVFWSNRGTRPGLYITEIYTGRTQRLLNRQVTTTTGLSWSEDGSQLVFGDRSTGDDELYVLDMTCGLLPCDEPTRLLSNVEIDDASPQWSPDGQWLVFVSNWKLESSWQIYTVNENGENLRQLTRAETYSFWPTWSPDGRLIAFISNRDQGWQVYVMRAECASLLRVNCAAQPLTDGMSIARGLSWSPDGAWIAFSSEQANNRDLYVVDTTCIHLDGDHLQVDAASCQTERLTHDGAYDIYPIWQP